MDAPDSRRTSIGVVGRAVAAVALTGVCWVIGLSLTNALAIALFAITLFTLRRLPLGDVDRWQPEPESAHNTGTRREVARLSWGLHGQDARVDRWSANRLRRLASHRLAERGLDLDSPGHEAACRRVLGNPAYDAVAADPNHLPRYATFVAALDVIESLTPPDNRR